MLPIAYVQEFNVGLGFFLFFVLNVIIHADADNEKANRKTINLWQDQLIHMGQIYFTSVLLYI